MTRRFMADAPSMAVMRDRDAALRGLARGGVLKEGGAYWR
jgi:hypothetical protein